MCASSEVKCPKDVGLSKCFEDDVCSKAKESGRCAECWQSAIAYRAASEKITAADELYTELKSVFSCTDKVIYKGNIVCNTIGSITRDYINDIAKGLE